MPDFTIETMAQCQKGSSFHTFHINGYEQTIRLDERTNSSCTCKAFKFCKDWPKWCKHLAEAEKLVCDYHEIVHGPPKEKDGEKVCPKCGGPIKYVKVAV